jgi:uncharacterized protein YdaU (DUF1376 family)
VHYYQFNIADYAKDTMHLSNTEDLAYRRLLDRLYLDESPLTSDIKKLARRINMRGNEQEISDVLEDFFELTEEGYIQKRAFDEIARYAAKADTARANGSKGGRPKKPSGNPEETQSEPKKTQWVISGNPEETRLKANQELITNNQQPITNNQELTTNNQEPITKNKEQETKSNKSQQAAQVFEYYVSVFEKSRAKLTKERENQIKKALGVYSVTDLQCAILGCSKSKYHMGDNEQGKKYNEIERIVNLRTKDGRNNVEYFMGFNEVKEKNTLTADDIAMAHAEMFFGGGDTVNIMLD